jgi:hypothetical protein
MNFRKADATVNDELVKRYQVLPIEQLRAIIPHWAFGTDCHALLDPALRPGYNRYRIFMVNVSALISVANFNEVDHTQLFTDNKINNARVAGILDRWSNNLFVDPPTVYLAGKSGQQIEFLDGRHRTKTTYLLGYEHIPVAIDLEDIKAIGLLFNLDDH